jgi:23S rRNA pseudouridine1911/1915/1917 synthase
MKQTITLENKGKRLDQYIQTILTELSRTQIQNLIVDQKVLVNQTPVKKNYRLETDDILEINLDAEAPTHNLEAIDEPLNILFQDENIAVIDKPPFLPVHPDKNFSHKRTLVNLLLGNNIPLSKLGGEFRPGIVHRLDMDTSGLIVIAKTDAGYKHMRKQFEEHQIHKKYICLCIGELPSKKGLIKAPISRNPIDRKKMSVQATENAKNALSEFKVINTVYWEQVDKMLSLVEVVIPTGRTHQIRVHFTSIGFPLLGDTTYGNSKLNAIAYKLGLKRQFLHATKLQFIGPDQKSHTFNSPLPEELENFLQKINI